MTRCGIVIPARMDSKRFPGKPLVEHNGKTMLQRVWENASKVPDAEVVVTSPDQKVLDVAYDFGARVHYTYPATPNGTLRAITAFFGTFVDNAPETLINLQCDEPDLGPEEIERLIRFAEIRKNNIATLTADLLPTHMLNPNVVKAWTSASRCLWFARDPAFARESHVGIYALRGEAISAVLKTRIHQIAVNEGLEQLSWLVEGWPIYRAKVQGRIPMSINIPSDWKEFCKCHA